MDKNKKYKPFQFFYVLYLNALEQKDITFGTACIVMKCSIYRFPVYLTRSNIEYFFKY